MRHSFQLRALRILRADNPHIPTSSCRTHTLRVPVNLHQVDGAAAARKARQDDFLITHHTPHTVHPHVPLRAHPDSDPAHWR